MDTAFDAKIAVSMAAHEHAIAASSTRWVELDSLRGVAALVVFFYHCIYLLAVCPRWIEPLLWSPLVLFVYGGHQAVIMFFVLSGFVLYLPYKQPEYSCSYRKFAVRRICRIYLPYLVSVGAVLIAYLLFFQAVRPNGLSTLYGWKILSRRGIVLSLLNHVLFIGFFNRDVFNGVTWTLAEEMRISLVFPFIALLVRNWSFARLLVAATVGSALVMIMVAFTHHRSPWMTAHYGCLFALGSLLAANLERARDYWQRQSASARAGVLIASVLLCAYAPVFESMHPVLVQEELADWLIAIPVCVFLLVAVSEPVFSRLLRLPLLEQCGRTSYGIYLLHLPILFVLVNLWWSRLSHITLYAMALVVTLLAAELFYRFIEMPSIALGRRIAART